MAELLNWHFTVEFRGKGSGDPRFLEGIDHHRIGLPDLLIRSKESGRGVAWIEITGSRKMRRYFLIQASKLKMVDKLYLPIFCVYYVDETGDLYWIEMVVLKKYRSEVIMTHWCGKCIPQRVIITPREEWHHKIESLVEILKFLERKGRRETDEL